MKRRVPLTLFMLLLCLVCTACGNKVTGQGFELVDDDGIIVSYHLKCTECGHVYSTTHQTPLPEGETFEVDLNCDICFETIHLSISRK